MLAPCEVSRPGSLLVWRLNAFPFILHPPPILSENVPNMYLYTLHHRYYQWIGLRENLQETIDFPIKYGAFL